MPRAGSAVKGYVAAGGTCYPTQVFGPSAQHAGGGNTRVTTRGVETSADVYSRREVEDLGHVDAPCCRRRPVVEWCRCWCERGRRGWGTARTAGDAGDDGKEARAVGGVVYCTSRVMVKSSFQSSLCTLLLCSMCTELYSLYTLTKPLELPSARQA